MWQYPGGNALARSYDYERNATNSTDEVVFVTNLGFM